MKETVIGIDVGKYECVVYWNKEFFHVKNEEETLSLWFKKHKPRLKKEVSLIVYEPTGGYEKRLQKELEKEQLPYCRVHATQVRDFAKSRGILAKTDKLDAQVLADYAVRMEIKAKRVKEVAPLLKVLLSRREQVIAMRLQEENRLETSDELLGKWLKSHIVQLNEQLKDVEKEIKAIEKTDAEVKHLLALYTSIPGVGRVTGLQLIVDLPELLEEGDKTLAALVGLAPWNKDSGTHHGRRRTRGGRTRVRGLLYMAALVGSRYNPELKKFYTKLKQKGKATKVALIAVAHKLLSILRSVAQRQTVWVPIAEK